MERLPATRPTIMCLSAAIAFLAGCGGDDGAGDSFAPAPKPPDVLLPENPTWYEVALDTVTFGGPIRAQGCLLITGPITGDNPPLLDNGPNLRNVGLFVGNPLTGFPGNLWFGTHSGICTAANINCNQTALTEDLTFVTTNPDAGTIDVTVDSAYLALPPGRVGQLNLFGAATPDLGGGVFRIQTGDAALQFATDGTVTGSLSFFSGSGAAYVADLSGTFTDDCP